MSIRAATLEVVVDGDTAPAEAKLRTFSGTLSNFAASAGKAAGGLLTGAMMGVGLGAANAAMNAIQGVPAAIGAATQSASDLTETVNMMTVVMGTGAAATMKWSESATTVLGMSQQSALRAAGTFAAFGKSAGKAGQDLADFATGLTGLAADLASFYNTTPEDATQAIGAALRGEMEPIRRYQVLLDDATLRQTAFNLHITDSIKNVLTPQQRVLAVQAELWRQTGDAQGDVARTGGALAGQQRQLTANMADLSVVIGTAFLPSMTAAVTATNQLATSGMPTIKSWADDIGVSIAKSVSDVSALIEAINRLSQMKLPDIPGLGGIDLGGAVAVGLKLSNPVGGALGEAFNIAAQAARDYNADVTDAAGTSERLISTAQALAGGLTASGTAAVKAAQGLTDMQLASWSATLGLDRMTLAAQILSANMDAMASRMASNRAAIEGIFMGATDLLGAEGAAAGAREADAAFQAYHSTLVATETDPLVIKAKEKMWIDNQNRSFQDQRTALADAERAATSYATNGVNAIEKAYDDLGSKISGVVGSLTSLSEISVTAPATGDAANENAKRMADIANIGLTGQSWLADFQAEMPELYAQVMASTDPKGFAQTWVADFQAGLHPEALDRDIVKANIRRMILGEETMATYVAEIAAEIRAENGLAPVSTAITTGVTGALTDQEMGKAIGAATVTSVNTPAAIVEFQNAGEAAFGSWRTGWESAASGWQPPAPGGAAAGPVTNPAGGAGTRGSSGWAQQPNAYSATGAGRAAVNVTVNVTATPGSNPAAVGQAAQRGVLDALRARGRV